MKAAALLLAALGALLWSATDWARHRFGTAPRPSPRRTAAIAVESAVTPHDSPCERDPDGSPGFVVLAPRDGTAEGLGVATLFADRDGDVHLGQWYDVTGTQRGGGTLDLRRWLRERRPAGPWHLRYGLWMRRGDHLEAREGWARLSTAQLRTTGVRIVPAAGATAVVTVRTATGQAIPGALLAIDRDGSQPAGVVSQLAHTGDDGTLHLSGLAPDTDYTVRLPDGVGPACTPLEERLAAGGAVELVVHELGEKWRFTRCEVRFALPGGSARITAVTGARPHEPARAWPVSTWIGSGLQPAAPLYLMAPAAGSGDRLPLTVWFARRDGAVHLDDAREPQRFALGWGTGPVRATRLAGPR